MNTFEVFLQSNAMTEDESIELMLMVNSFTLTASCEERAGTIQIRYLKNAEWNDKVHDAIQLLRKIKDYPCTVVYKAYSYSGKLLNELSLSSLKGPVNQQVSGNYVTVVLSDCTYTRAKEAND